MFYKYINLYNVIKCFIKHFKLHLVTSCFIQYLSFYISKLHLFVYDHIYFKNYKWGNEVELVS